MVRTEAQKKASNKFMTKLRSVEGYQDKTRYREGVYETKIIKQRERKHANTSILHIKNLFLMASKF